MNTSAQSLIHLDGVTKVFFTDEVETHALAGIHLEIKSGEYIAIAGPSGCGKSTLVRAGLVPLLHRRGQSAVVVVPGGDPTGTLIEHSHELALARRSFLLMCYATGTLKSLKRSAARHEAPTCS